MFLRKLAARLEIFHDTQVANHYNRRSAYLTKTLNKTPNERQKSTHKQVCLLGHYIMKYF